MKNLFVGLILLFVGSLQAQEVIGDWHGALNINGMELRIVFHINKNDGHFSTTMDSPDQAANGIPTDKTTYKDGALIIEASKLGMKYTAQFDEKSKNIDGTFSQNGMDFPLKMIKKEKNPTVKNPNKEISKDAKEVLGTWNGAIDIQGMQLRIVFNVSEFEGELVTTLDSPDQGAKGIPTDKTTYKDGTLTIVASKLGINYEAKFEKEKNTIDGTFKQNGMDMPLSMSREKVEKKEVVRPQEPKDFPYEREEIKFQNPKGEHYLAGTLTIPSNGKFEKVVVLITGSGPQNRNEELLGHKPFLVLSDYLTRNGIAVLRYDDRGVAESMGDFQSATSRDFADDANAAVSFLKKRKDMAGKKVGLMGHSEGGMIAPMVASENSNVDFIVLLAGPGIDIKELMMLQTDKIAEAGETPKEVREANGKLLSNIFEYLKTTNTSDKEVITKGLRKVMDEGYEKFSDEMKEEIGSKDELFESQSKMMLTDWFLYFMKFNPDDYLKKVTCPVLAINGELDLQVTAKENLAGIENSLKKSNNTNVTIREFKGLNHLFQKAKTGAPSEYATLEETFNQEAMTFVWNWINQLK